MANAKKNTETTATATTTVVLASKGHRVWTTTATSADSADVAASLARLAEAHGEADLVGSGTVVASNAAGTLVFSLQRGPNRAEWDASVLLPLSTWRADRPLCTTDQLEAKLQKEAERNEKKREKAAEKAEKARERAEKAAAKAKEAAKKAQERAEAALAKAAALAA